MAAPEEYDFCWLMRVGMVEVPIFFPAAGTRHPLISVPLRSVLQKALKNMIRYIN